MSVCVLGVSEMALALLTQMSSPPKVATVFATAACTCSSKRMSQAIGSALPPAASISLAAVKMVPSSLGWGSADLAAMAMLAPSLGAFVMLRCQFGASPDHGRSLPM
jgi:hypothetical protein